MYITRNCSPFPTDAQLAPKQWKRNEHNLQNSFYMIRYGIDHPFDQLKSNILVLFLPSSLGPFLRMALVLYDCLAVTVNISVINIVFLLETKHSIIPDTLKKIIPCQLKLRHTIKTRSRPACTSFLCSSCCAPLSVLPAKHKIEWALFTHSFCHPDPQNCISIQSRFISQTPDTQASFIHYSYFSKPEDNLF